MGPRGAHGGAPWGAQGHGAPWGAQGHGPQGPGAQGHGPEGPRPQKTFFSQRHLIIFYMFYNCLYNLYDI